METRRLVRWRTRTIRSDALPGGLTSASRGSLWLAGWLALALLAPAASHAAIVTFGFDATVEYAAAPYGVAVGTPFQGFVTYDSNASPYQGGFPGYETGSLRLEIGGTEYQYQDESGAPLFQVLTDTTYSALAMSLLVSGGGQVVLALEFGQQVFPDEVLSSFDPLLLNDPSRLPYGTSLLLLQGSAAGVLDASIGQVFLVPEPAGLALGAVIAAIAALSRMRLPARIR
jgi:hypothetical protein